MTPTRFWLSCWVVAITAGLHDDTMRVLWCKESQQVHLRKLIQCPLEAHFRDPVSGEVFESSFTASLSSARRLACVFNNHTLFFFRVVVFKDNLHFRSVSRPPFQEGDWFEYSCGASFYITDPYNVTRVVLSVSRSGQTLRAKMMSTVPSSLNSMLVSSRASITNSTLLRFNGVPHDATLDFTCRLKVQEASQSYTFPISSLLLHRVQFPVRKVGVSKSKVQAAKELECVAESFPPAHLCLCTSTTASISHLRTTTVPIIQPANHTKVFLEALGGMGNETHDALKPQDKGAGMDVYYKHKFSILNVGLHNLSCTASSWFKQRQVNMTWTGQVQVHGMPSYPSRTPNPPLTDSTSTDHARLSRASHEEHDRVELFCNCSGGAVETVVRLQVVLLVVLLEGALL